MVRNMVHPTSSPCLFGPVGNGGRLGSIMQLCRCAVVHNEGGHQLRDNFVDLQMSKDVLLQLLETRLIRRARC